MSFRGRLRVFFTIIVIVPMIAVALVLFALTGRSEMGKADAGIAAGLRAAVAVYQDEVRRAEPALRRIASDPSVRSALANGRPRAAGVRLRRLVGEVGAVRVDLYGKGSKRLAHAGSWRGIAPAAATLSLKDGRRVGKLAVSVTSAARYAREVRRLSGLDVSVFRSGRRLATTLGPLRGRPEPAAGERAREFEAAGSRYRGRAAEIDASAGPAVEIAVFEGAEALRSSIARSRILIGVVLAVFLLLALGLALFVVRALQGQIKEFLAAARRLARGDFGSPVPTHGRDEFAQLGREFNTMSRQLEVQIEEVERKRRELEETIRRVGEAFASGLDRQGIVELTVETAVDACDADTGRALPVDRRAFDRAWAGVSDPPLSAALEAAERKAFSVRPGVGRELLEPASQPGSRPASHRPVEAALDGVHALAVPLRARPGSGGAAEYVGVVSVARRARPFEAEEANLLEYLVTQAVVSIENADLHETARRQAVTDELTGLSNVRELNGSLDREVERSRRFDTPLSLVMVDIDDFKRVNDEYGHQRGDEVLVEVARVLRRLSRDLDEPARYGGEELAVVLPQTDIAGATRLAERMRREVERLRIPLGDGRGDLKVTASFGVAAVRGGVGDKASLLAAADAALYRAKRGGKNRVERSDAVLVHR